MPVTPDTLARMAGTNPNANMVSVIAGLKARPSGLDRPHRLAHYLGQTAHESALWRFDHELWGPTVAQRGYEARKDLGNTHPGDGFKFRGRGPIQLTGWANYAAFTAWARAVDPMAPDFTVTPDAILTDPWEGLVPIWFWGAHDLGALADRGDIAGITRKINGGLNGLTERIALTAKAGAVIYGVRNVREFQIAHALTPDGVPGPITLGMLHRVLSAMPAVTFQL